jgi:regulatory protein spx
LQHNIKYQDINLLQTPPVYEELISMARLAGLEVKDLVNKKSQVFKKMNISLPELSELEIADLIKENPRILIRPVLTNGSQIILGFKETVYQDFLTPIN